MLVAQRFLLNFNFFGNMILRDLCLRSSELLTSFSLVKHVFDDTVSFLIEARLAALAHSKETLQSSPSDVRPTTNNSTPMSSHSYEMTPLSANSSISSLPIPLQNQTTTMTATQGHTSTRENVNVTTNSNIANANVNNNVNNNNNTNNNNNNTDNRNVFVNTFPQPPTHQEFNAREFEPRERSGSMELAGILGLRRVSTLDSFDTLPFPNLEKSIAANRREPSEALNLVSRVKSTINPIGIDWQNAAYPNFSASSPLTVSRRGSLINFPNFFEEAQLGFSTQNSNNNNTMGMFNPNSAQRTKSGILLSSYSSDVLRELQSLNAPNTQTETNESESQVDLDQLSQYQNARGRYMQDTRSSMLPPPRKIGSGDNGNTINANKRKRE